MISNILENSEIIINKDDITNSVKCLLLFANENKIKEELTFEKICEMNEIFMNYKTDINFKDNIEIFLNLINNIKKIIDKINILYNNGYPFNKIINLKLNEGIIFSKDDNNKIDLDKLINYFDNINISFKKTQFNYYKENQIIRFFYGKLFMLLLNRINNKKKIESKREINNFLKYISNNIIQKDIDIKDFFVENENNLDEYFIQITKYLNETLLLNKASLEIILKPNYIREDFYYIKGGIYYISYSDIKYLENNIINIYCEITGNYPINTTILICNEEISFEKIYSFLISSFLCEYPVLFSLINLDLMNLSLRNKIISLIEKLNNLFNDRQSSLIIIGKEADNNDIVKKINEISKNRIIILDNKDSKGIKYKYENVEIIKGIKSGLGKSKYIKNHIINELKKKYIYFPIGGVFKRKEIINRLKKLHIEKDSVIHLDLKQTSLYSLLREFLFKLLILKSYDINENIFYLGNNINIIIELPYGFIDYLQIIPFLDIFTQKEFDKMLELRVDIKDKMKIRDSNIQIVSNILKLYYENKINIESVDLESEILLKEEECQIILDRFFKENNFGDNWYQKTMLINFLAVQFIMFTECATLNLELTKGTFTEMNMNNTIVRARPKIIEALINSAILATSGPFDKLIEIENESFKENINFNEINNDRKDIDTINYDSIKGCLFFFNEDKQFFTIISNNPTNEDYDLFLSLFNTQEINDVDDFDLIQKHHLIDYGNLSHEKYIQELRKIFNIPEEINIKEIAKQNDNYTFTRDNFLKMILIYFRIKSNIPVILMGETGCGKTSLIKMLSLLINKGKEKMKIMNIHGGITDNDIINFIKKCEKEIEENKKKEIENEINKFKESKEKKYYKEEIIEKDIIQKIKEEKVWIFFDEINTCNSLGLIKEIMLEKTMNGEKIDDSFVFIGSCNPYRIITKKMKESGLIYQPGKVDKKFPELVYNVNPLPISLINYIFNFGSLTQKDEKIYMSSIIQIYFDKLKKKGEKTNSKKEINIEVNQIEKEKINIVDSIIFCHNYLKGKFDNSLVSLRDIRRFIIFYDWFLKYLINESTQKNIYKNCGNKLLKDCLNLTIYLCYYLRLSDMNLRIDFRIKMGLLLEIDFLELPLKEEKYITSQFIQDNQNEIILNRMLRENLLTLFICINVRQPLIIIGKPGTGKTLSINCINNSMKGEFSDNNYFKRKCGLVIYRYQGSEKTRSEDIINIFKNVRNSMEILKRNNENINNISMFLFDEMGLVQKGENNPLKVLHSELEFNSDKSNKISFVGISNWRLDSAKMNRVLYLLVSEPNNDELVETAINIAEFLDKNLSSKYDYFFCSLAKTYFKYKNLKFDDNKDIKEYFSYYFNDFHGNRDFYFFIKDCMNDLIEQKSNIDYNNSNLILTKIGLKNIEKNFGGLPNIIEIIKSIFLEEFSLSKSNDFNNNYNPINYIQDNLIKDNRFLMLLNNSSLNEFLLSCILKNLKYRNYILIQGSPFISDNENSEKGNIYKEKVLKRIQSLSNGENILLMKNLDSIYPFLFNLFNFWLIIII